MGMGMRLTAKEDEDEGLGADVDVPDHEWSKCIEFCLHVDVSQSTAVLWYKENSVQGLLGITEWR